MDQDAALSRLRSRVRIPPGLFYDSVTITFVERTHSRARGSNNGQAHAAMCDDLAHNAAKPAQEANAQRLTAAYYGWAFTFDPTKVDLHVTNGPARP